MAGGLNKEVCSSQSFKLYMLSSMESNMPVKILFKFIFFDCFLPRPDGSTGSIIAGPNNPEGHIATVQITSYRRSRFLFSTKTSRSI